MKRNKIPQMFYLRKYWIKVQVGAGEHVSRLVKCVHVYWSYRDPIPRIIETDNRHLAKEAIITGYLPAESKKDKPRLVCKPNPEADFWRP